MNLKHKYMRTFEKCKMLTVIRSLEQERNLRKKTLEIKMTSCDLQRPSKSNFSS